MCNIDHQTTEPRLLAASNLSKSYEYGDRPVTSTHHLLEDMESPCRATQQEIAMGRNKAFIALSAAVVLGVLGTASAVLAGDSGENSQGGSVMPGSMVGVNPAYHPGFFRYAAHNGSAGAAFAYVVSPRGEAYKKQGANHQTWCDVDSQCNGWANK
jgi:hypothetical protein